MYDAGVLIAADRDERAFWADHRARLELGFLPVTTAPAVAQVSRSPRQVSLHRFLRGCRTVPFGSDQATVVGALLARTKTSDVVDAHLAVAAADLSAVIVTGDSADMRVLVAELDQPVVIMPIA